MELLFELQSLLIGLIGWAASMLVLQGVGRLTANDKRAMGVCIWVLWMTPTFGALVRQGLLATNTAALFVGATTLALGALVLFGAWGGTRRMRP